MYCIPEKERSRQESTLLTDGKPSHEENSDFLKTYEDAGGVNLLAT